jgi:hypothetical protein
MGLQITHGQQESGGDSGKDVIVQLSKQIHAWRQVLDFWRSTFVTLAGASAKGS